MESNKKIIKRLKVITLIFIVLSSINIIMLINNKSYALFRKIVTSNKRIIEIHTASKFPSKPGIEVLKSKLGTDGLVGIPINCNETSCEAITDKSVDKSTIREYRYSGATANNYVYFNCKDNMEHNASNCENWRIIGIFKDEEGQEHLKIVRNELLKRDVFPVTYEANGEIFNIQVTSGGDYAYYNAPTITLYSNNWAEAGLKYWLNSEGTTNGYLESLSSTAQNMIEETKYYLGSVTANIEGNDTLILAYEHERMVTGCTENKGPSTNSNKNVVEGNNSCRVWANNAATWEGKIGLMYPSDYGFSASDTYWSKTALSNYNIAAANTSWLFKEANHLAFEWFILPNSRTYYGVAVWENGGNVSDYGAAHEFGVRPSLYLKSETQFVSGNGSSGRPYDLSL